MFNKKLWFTGVSSTILALLLISPSIADTCKVNINIAGQWNTDVTFVAYPQQNVSSASIQNLGTFAAGSHDSSFQCVPGDQYVVTGSYTVKAPGQPTGATYPHTASAFEATPEMTYQLNWPNDFGAPTMAR